MSVDSQGYRLNVGMVVLNAEGKLFWGQNANRAGWQFPQGGIEDNETATEGMYRELHEEVGLSPQDVKILQVSKQWYSYKLPEQFIRRHEDQLVIGQKQKWFLLQLLANDQQINFTTGHKPEFKAWQWVNYWYPAKNVIYFKQEIYKNVLQEFAAAAT